MTHKYTHQDIINFLSKTDYRFVTKSILPLMVQTTHRIRC